MILLDFYISNLNKNINWPLLVLNHLFLANFKEIQLLLLICMLENSIQYDVGTMT